MVEARYSRFQTGADLLKQALGGPVTRVPVYAQMHEFVAHRLNIPNRIFYSRADIRVPAMLDVQAEFDIDVATITHDVYNIEAEGLGQPLIFNDECMPDVDRTKLLIQESDDLGKIRTPSRLEKRMPVSHSPVAPSSGEAELRNQVRSQAGAWEREERSVGRASPPARRSAQAGKPVPPEELFKAVAHGPLAHP